MPPRLARLLAVVAALAMIGGAFWFRSRGGSDGGDDPGPTTSTGGALSIVCVDELADVCKAIKAAHPDIEQRAERASVTAATLAKADPGKPPFDAWVTLDPWPGMVASSRTIANLPELFAEGPSTVASSPLAAVLPAERFAALAGACPKKDWACVAATAGMSWASVAPGTADAANWGSVKLGVGDPGSALGSVVFGQIVQSVAAAKKLPDNPGTGDFDPYVNLLRRPAASASQADSDDQLTQLITQPGSLSLVATTAGTATRFVNTAQAQQQGLQVVQLTPTARADVLVAPLVSGKRAAQAVALFTDQTGTTALTTGDWTPGAPATSSGMPAADVLAALLDKIG